LEFPSIVEPSKNESDFDRPPDEDGGDNGD